MCILCDLKIVGNHHPSEQPHLDYKKHGDGIEDHGLAIEYDPLFSSVLGTGVNRRELLKWGGLGALSSLMPTSATFAQEKNGIRQSASAICRSPMPRPCWSRTRWASSRRKAWIRRRRP